MMWLGRIPGRQFYPLVLGLFVLFAVGFSTLRSLPDDAHHPFYQTKVTSRFCTWHHRVADEDMDTSVPADSFVITDGNRQKVHARIAVANADLTGVLPGNSYSATSWRSPFPTSSMPSLPKNSASGAVPSSSSSTSSSTSGRGG